jgi:hypothetical protein
MKNPALMIQSGYRMINNLNQVATHMMDTFKGLIGQQHQLPQPHFAQPHISEEDIREQQRIAEEDKTEYRQLSDLKKEFEKIPDILPPGSGKKIAIVGDPLVEMPRMRVVKEEVSEPQPEEAHRPHRQVFVHAEEVEFKD